MSANLPPLQHYMRLEKFTQPSNDFAGDVGTWSTICNLWASIKTVRAEQKIQNALVEKTVTHTITTRYDSRVPLTNERLRMVDVTRDEREYNIGGFVDVDEMHERYEWEATEVRT